ncbi:MAG: GvpL/GvpF family gas vesicle protein [Chloroflexaceae bacterium]|jgi:hypothetical protein|nr:GvpL/GvpF family gas vesicle protein [Chloroflexaceae bacterium]
MNNTTTTDGVYLYCIIRCPETRTFGSPGIGDRGDTVYTVQCGDLAMVVSDSPIVEYDSTRRNMMAHTRVIEEVMAEFTVLPIRFGIIAPNAEVVRAQLLERRYDELCNQLNSLDSRIELGLKAFWQENVIYREVVERDPVIRSLRDSLAGRSPEETHYERIRLGELVEAAIVQQRATDAEKILGRLRPLVQQTQTSPALTDRMVVNAAFLLERTQEVAFDQMIQELDAEMGQRMLFKYVGPVPPYNFVNLTINWN